MKVRELTYSTGTAVGMTWPPSVWLRVGGGRSIPNMANAILREVDFSADASPEENDLYITVEDESGVFSGPIVVEGSREYRAYLAGVLGEHVGSTLGEIGEVEIEAP